MNKYRFLLTSYELLAISFAVKEENKYAPADNSTRAQLHETKKWNSL